MLPRLQARERLAGVSDGALSAGNLRRQDARRSLRRLFDAADDGGAPRRAAKATPSVLAGMGVGVRTVPVAPPKKALSDA